MQARCWTFVGMLALALGCGDDGVSASDGTDTDATGTGTTRGSDTFETGSHGETAGTTDVDTDEESSSETGPTTDPDPYTFGERVDCKNTLAVPEAGELCAVTPGDGALLLEGTVLAGGQWFDNGQVLVEAAAENARILCAGCDCGARPEAATATRLSCPEGVISPGLINAHDHITYAHVEPKSHGDERFEHRHDWREGLRGHREIQYPRAENAAILYGELRMLFGGATSVTGSIASANASGLLRNLDSADMTEGLSGIDVNYRTFPLDDLNGTLRASGCNYGSIDNESRLAAGNIYLPHIAEGIDPEAHNEFECLSGGAVDLIQSKTSVIHAIGLLPDDVQLMGERGSSLVWSPRTNVDLYGITANVLAFRHAGVPIALGTDWSISGSMNVLRELQCADHLNTSYLGQAFTDIDLWLMSTYWAAVSQGAADQIGLIAAGRIADLVVFDAAGREGYRAVIEASPTEVALVLRGGVPLHGDAALVEALVPAAELGGCEPLSLCDRDKRLCAQRDTGLTLAGIRAGISYNNPYPLFFCGVPENEPSCEPFRDGEFPIGAGDVDGDGIVDGDDNCPNVFNPIRVLDRPTQGDADSDGIGDACDACPLESGQACTLVNPYDRDGDEVFDVDDVCPTVADPNQADSDGDGLGDACDACPVANPGGGACPATIYDVKDGTISTGQAVVITNALVTAVRPGQGFIVQVHPNDPDYEGVDWSGLYVYLGGSGSLPGQGDRVRVAGSVQDYFGQTQLSSVTEVTVLSSGNALPTAEPAAEAEVVPGGSRRERLEGVLVQLTDLEITDVSPPGGGGDANPQNEYETAGGLRIDDWLGFVITPPPTVGQVFPQMRGILVWANDRSKLAPRDTGDIGEATVAGFVPPLSFLRAGTTGVPIPGLELHLSRAVDNDTVVALTYENPAVVSGPATVTVTAGHASVSLSLTAGLGTGIAGVTATQGESSVQGDVRVYDDTDVRLVDSLAPAVLALGNGGAGTLTVTLDVPAGTGGQAVAIAAEPGTAIDVPGSVLVPANALTASFPVNAIALGSEVVTASIGASQANASVDVQDSPSFPDVRIVELYYNHTGNDDGFEWVKLYNGTGTTVNLSTYSLGWGGTNYTYGTAQLSGTVANGECFLVGGPSGNAVSGSPVFDLALNFSPDIQNGGDTADGVALFNVAAALITPATIPVDAVIYGTTNTNALADENGPGGVVDVGNAPAESSVHFLANGTWAFNPSPAPNACLPFPPP